MLVLRLMPSGAGSGSEFYLQQNQRKTDFTPSLAMLLSVHPEMANLQWTLSVPIHFWTGIHGQETVDEID